MLNNVILVGRVVEEPQLRVLESGHQVANVVLAIQKPFRNEENQYESDFIPVVAWMKTAEIICDYVGKGSILGCKCRLQTHTVEVGDLRMKTIDVIVERISFIYTKPRSDKARVKTQEEIPKKGSVPFNEDFADEVIVNNPEDRNETQKDRKNGK